MQARNEQEKHYSIMLQKLMADLTPEEIQALESGNSLEGEGSTAFQTLNTVLSAGKNANANDYDRSAALQIRNILAARRDISKLLLHVVDGTAASKEEEIVACMQSYPFLLTQRADMKDSSGRLFKDITVLELALWAAAVWKTREVGIGAHILEIAHEQTWLKDKLLAQYENWEKNGVVYELDGQRHVEKHYDFLPLVSALQIYYGKDEEKRTVEYWNNEVKPVLIKAPANTVLLIKLKINEESPGFFELKAPLCGVPAMFERKKEEGLVAFKQFFQPAEQLSSSSETSEGKKGMPLLIMYSEKLKEEKADVEKIFSRFKDLTNNPELPHAEYVFHCGNQIDRKRFCDLLEKFFQAGVPLTELQSFFVESAFVKLLNTLENEDNLLDVQILFTLLKTGILPEEYYSVHVKSEENAPRNLRERESKLFAQAEKVVFEYIDRLPKNEKQEAQTLILKKDSPLAKFFSAPYKNKIALPTPAGYGTASWLTSTADKKDKQKSMAKSTQQIFTL